MLGKDRHTPHRQVYITPQRSLTRIILLLQDAQRKELDLRAPVQKQRAKKFNLEEELEKLKAAQQQEYTNKSIERPKEWWEQGTRKE